MLQPAAVTNRGETELGKQVRTAGRERERKDQDQDLQLREKPPKHKTLSALSRRRWLTLGGLQADHEREHLICKWTRARPRGQDAAVIRPANGPDLYLSPHSALIPTMVSKDSYKPDLFVVVCFFVFICSFLIYFPLILVS